MAILHVKPQVRYAVEVATWANNPKIVRYDKDGVEWRVIRCSKEHHDLIARMLESGMFMLREFCDYYDDERLMRLLIQYGDPPPFDFKDWISQ